MLAVRSHAAGQPLALEERPIPEVNGGAVRIRVAGCGVCHTDLHIARTDRIRVTRPITLGHEIAGWIDDFGPDAERALRQARLRSGDAVLVFGGWGCGHCTECLAGDEQRCADGASPGFQVDGGYAEYVLVPDVRHLVPLGDLDPIHAAPLADAGVTPYRAVRRASRWLVPGSRAIIIGFGGLGQFALQYLQALPDVTVAVTDIEPDKLAAATALGADLAVLVGDESLVALGLSGPPEVVFDFVGTDETLAMATRLVAPGGLVSLVGEGGGGLDFGFSTLPHEAYVTTTAWGSVSELREVMKLARRRRLRWEVDIVPLREAQAAHDRLAAGRVPGRVVLVPDAAGDH